MEIRIFQIVVPIVASLFIMSLFYRRRKSKITLYELVLGLFFGVATVLISIFPDRITNLIAQIFDIKSNVNALIFLSLGILFFIQFQIYSIVRKQEKDTTRLVRQLALQKVTAAVVPPKILFVLEHYYPYIGGSEFLFTELTQHLVQKGYTVKVVTTKHNRYLPSREVLNRVEVHRIRCWNRYLFTFLSLPKIIQLAEDCDVIHTTTYNAALPAWIAGKLVNKPVVITFHEVWNKLWFQLPFLNVIQKRAFYWYERCIIKLPFHRYVAVSKYTQNSLQQLGIPSHQIVQIYNGIDYAALELFKHTTPNIFTITYFGRLGVSKGLDILLPAFQLFCKQFPTVKLQLIIPQKPTAFFRKIEQKIQDLNIIDNVVLYHNLDKDVLYQKVSQSSCVVIPSYSEGFCFVAAETIGLQVPIISSQRGALEEVVSGRYLPIKSLNANGLYEAFVKAKNEEWQTKPQKYFHIGKSVEQYDKFYGDLLLKKSSL